MFCYYLISFNNIWPCNMHFLLGLTSCWYWGTWPVFSWIPLFMTLADIRASLFDVQNCPIYWHTVKPAPGLLHCKNVLGLPLHPDPKPHLSCGSGKTATSLFTSIFSLPSFGCASSNHHCDSHTLSFFMIWQSLRPTRLADLPFAIRDLKRSKGYFSWVSCIQMHDVEWPISTLVFCLLLFIAWIKWWFFLLRAIYWIKAFEGIWVSRFVLSADVISQFS